MKKLFVLLLILSFLAPLFSYPKSVQAAEDTSGYYGYQSKKVVSEALYTTDQSIPGWKIAALIDKLSDDGYFWMKTKKEKLKYIHQNLSANQYLSIVADAEDIHSWTVNGRGTSELSITESKKIDSQLRPLINTSYREWQNFYARTASLGDGQHSVSKNAIKYGWKKCFYTKSAWDKGDLDRLYTAYWPNQHNRNKIDFTPEEMKKLDRVWAAADLQRFEKEYDKDHPALVIKDIPPTTFDMAMYLLPEIGLTAALSKGALKSVLKVGSKSVEKQAANLVSREMAAGGEAVIERTTAKIADRYLTLKLNYTGKVVFNLSKIYAKSTLTAAERQAATVLMNKTVNSVMGHDIAGKYIDQNLVSKMFKTLEVWDRPTMLKMRGKANVSGCCYPGICGGFKKIAINEGAFRREDVAMTTIIHEMFHAASKQGAAYGKKFYSKITGGSPIDEGVTEALTEIFVRDSTGLHIVQGSYANETEVAMSMIGRLDAKYGAGQGVKIMSDIHFKQGLEKGLDKYLAKGAHAKIQEFMVNGNYDGAIQYIRKL